MGVDESMDKSVVPVSLSAQQTEAYERGTDLLVELLGEVEPLSPSEEEVLEKGVSAALFLRGDEACFDDVVEWLSSSDDSEPRNLGRLLGLVKKTGGGVVEGARFGLPHVVSFSSPLVSSSDVELVVWEIDTLSPEDDTPVLRVGDEYAVVLTPPVAAKMYRALGAVLKQSAPEVVREEKKTWKQRGQGLLGWAKRHKFVAGFTVVIVGMVVVGLIVGIGMGFATAGGSAIPR